MNIRNKPNNKFLNPSVLYVPLGKIYNLKSASKKFGLKINGF